MYHATFFTRLVYNYIFQLAQGPTAFSCTLITIVVSIYIIDTFKLICMPSNTRTEYNSLHNEDSSV